MSKRTRVLLSEISCDRSEIPDRCGVYLLMHRVTGDTYVGSALGVRTRIWGHVSLIRTGGCTQRRLSALCDKHGIAFDVAVLQLCPPSKRVRAERKWIRLINPTLNVQRNPVATKGRFFPQRSPEEERRRRRRMTLRLLPREKRE